MLTKEPGLLWQLLKGDLFEHDKRFYVVIAMADVETDSMPVRCIGYRMFNKIVWHTEQQPIEQMAQETRVDAWNADGMALGPPIMPLPTA